MLFRSEKDSDNDGIVDSVDACPNAKETFNKFQDTDGCPDNIIVGKLISDSDDDGISDYVDLCPSQPETYNGINDLDGCPDSFDSGDNDFDGILNNVDACPNAKENYNMFQDTDGCPDSVIGLVSGDADGDGIADIHDA